jgi:branched-chain amino acid transport system permease protein
MDLVIYGFINSLNLSLIATGFALVYGVSRVPNFAHGAFYVLTGCLSWIFLNKVGLNYVACIVLSLGITTLAGLLMYRLIIIRVRGMPISEIIASFAIGMAILEAFRLAGFRGPQYGLPKFVEGTLNIFNVPVDWQRIILIIAGLSLVAILHAFTHYTRIGLGLRAIAQDEPAALMLGIDSDLAATVALAIGSALVGIAAVVILPLGTITVETGYDVLIFAIAVCIVGGLGSWLGAVVASFVIGYLQIVTVRFIAPHFQLVVALLAIVLILILRPSGLLGKQKQLEERV